MYEFLDLNQAEAFVTKESDRGHTMYWEGWDIVSWRPNNVGYMRSDGAFKYGRWGTMRRIKPNRFGKYRVSVNSR